MNTLDYNKIGRVVAGGALVAFGLARRSLVGMLLTGIGAVVIQRALKSKDSAIRSEAPESAETRSVAPHGRGPLKKRAAKKAAKKAVATLVEAFEADDAEAESATSH